MAPLALIPLLSYVLISSFTPGPATLTTSSLGVLYGFRRTLAFQGGLALGVAVMMAVGGLISAGLLAAFPLLEPLLRYVGAAYILYLAYRLLRASYQFTPAHSQPLGFRHGLALQLSNPKLVVYAFTLFATFLAPIAGRALWVAAAALLLALVSAAATVAWALFGGALKAWLRQPRVALWVNAGLAACLALTALDLAGLL